MFMLVTVLRLLLHIVPLSPLGLNLMSTVFDAYTDADAVSDNDNADADAVPDNDNADAGTHLCTMRPVLFSSLTNGGEARTFSSVLTHN